MFCLEVLQYLKEKNEVENGKFVTEEVGVGSRQAFHSHCSISEAISDAKIDHVGTASIFSQLAHVASFFFKL
jgi:hypothetical protein